MFCRQPELITITPLITRHYPTSPLLPNTTAVFTALTAIFAKVGVKGVDSDLATAIRTVVILLVAWGIVFARSELAGLPLLSRNNWLFLILSAVIWRQSWWAGLKAGRARLYLGGRLLVLLLALWLAVLPVLQVRRPDCDRYRSR